MLVTTEKSTNKMLAKSFGVKSYSQIKKELDVSESQFSRGEYKESGVVLKGLRAKYGL